MFKVSIHSVVVMMHIQEVCCQYWPSTGLIAVGEYIVELLGEEKMKGFIIRTLSIVDRKVLAYNIVHCHHCWILITLVNLIVG